MEDWVTFQQNKFNRVYLKVFDHIFIFVVQLYKYESLGSNRKQILQRSSILDTTKSGNGCLVNIFWNIAKVIPLSSA